MSDPQVLRIYSTAAEGKGCGSCGMEEHGAEANECPRSKRPCGHHCNHVWEHDECDWCGVQFGEGGSAKWPGKNCWADDCTRTVDDGPLHRVNPKGVRGIFMCQWHAREVDRFENRELGKVHVEIQKPGQESTDV